MPPRQITLQDKCVTAARKELSDQRSLESAERILNAAMGGLREDFFIRHDVAFLRETFVGCRLAKHLNASSIQIIEEAYPDIRIFFGNSFKDFECTEVMDSQRRRGEEYSLLKENRLKGEKPPLIEIPSHLLSSKSCQMAIHNRCKKKIERYGFRPQEVGLVVYLNDYWPLEEDLSSIVAGATHEASMYFNGVYVLTDGKILASK